MAKKDRKRTHNKNIYQYSAKTSPGDLEYFGIHKNGDRIKIDVKRMKKICEKNGPRELYEVALKISDIPRNTAYFIPKKRKRLDYVTNEFRQKIDTLREQWHEIRKAFENIKTPKQVTDEYRLDALSYTSSSDDYDEIEIDAMMAGIKREASYFNLEASVCAQFIHQMATELDAIMLRKCRYLGFNPPVERQVTRDIMHTYIESQINGRCSIDELPNHKEVYRKFFMIWNLLKHNSENLFVKVQENYPDMLLTKTYRNGEMSMYYLKIGNDYIEKMLNDLRTFYEDVAETFFGEDKEESLWNYDEFFVDEVREWNDLMYC